jgi:inner membrane protein YidH
MSAATAGPASPATTVVTSTDLAHERTDLALLRSYMAAERTLMAWIRTTLSMISFGFTLAKLGQAVHDVEVKKLLGGVEIVGVRRIGYFLVVLGTVALFGATIQYWFEFRELRSQGLNRKFSISMIVAVVLVLLGGLAFTSLVGNF